MDGPVHAPPRPAPRFQARARLVLALALFVAGAWTIKAFLPALVWAAILAIATWPLVRHARARLPGGGYNILLPLVFTLVVALCVLVPLAVAAIQLGREAAVVFHLVEEARRSGIPAPAWLADLPYGAGATAWWTANLADPEGYSAIAGRLNHAALYGFTRELGGQLLHRSVVFGFTLVSLFFLYRDGDRVGAQALAASRRAFGPHGERIAGQIVASVKGTVDGLVLVGLGVGAVIGVAYAVAGVPHPTLFGAATAIAATVPFGAPLVFTIAALLLLAEGSTAAAAALLAFGVAVVFVADHFVRPALIGGATRLPFLWVLLGILGGVETWGLLGLFLGPAIMATLILIWRDWTGGAAIPPPVPT